MFDWILEGGGGSESDTERDGFLSYSGEIHAVGIGASAGVLTAVTGNPAVALTFAALLFGKQKYENKHLNDASKEAAYSGAAFTFIYLITVLL